MMKKTTSVLAVLALVLLLQVKGNPLNEAERSVVPKTLPGSRIFPKADWLNFHYTWTFPSLPSVPNFFNGEDEEAKEAAHTKKRIDALEQSQNDIIKMLKKITQDIKPITSPCANKKPDVPLPEKPNEEPILPAKPAIIGQDKPKVTEQPTITENPLPELAMPDTPSEEKKDDKQSTIFEETTGKMLTESPTATKKQEILESQAEEANKNVSSTEPLAQPITRTNGRSPSIDDVNLP